MRPHLLMLLLVAYAGSSIAAPDEEKLGKAQGYPVGSASTWFYDESVRVGSFTAQGEIPGIFSGKANVLAASDAPMPLPQRDGEPSIRWNVDQLKDLTVDDYLARQRVMGLLIVKDGVIQVERYQYDRSPAHRFLSNSMAKTITSMAIGIALQEGKIHSLDERADQYAPRLAGTLYGETTIRNLLRMGSGVRFTENYDGKDDRKRYDDALTRTDIESAARLLTKRDAPQGTRFSYSSPETDMLGAVLQGATGMSQSDYLTPRLWQAIGAETSALWRADRTGMVRASGSFNATLRDYARLAIVLANDGVRPDDPQHKQIIPRDYLLDATDWHRAPEAFQPGRATSSYGYGYQVWLSPSEKRRFVLIGVYGQMIFVDPDLKLVMVQTSAAAEAKPVLLFKEANALWRGVVQQYGSW